jgi:hypothetical protein
LLVPATITVELTRWAMRHGGWPWTAPGVVGLGWVACLREEKPTPYLVGALLVLLILALMRAWARLDPLTCWP